MSVPGVSWQAVGMASSSPAGAGPASVTPETLDRFAAAWHTMAGLIARPPTQKSLTAVRGLAPQWPLPSRQGPAARGTDLMQRSDAEGEDAERLRQDHMRLFTGPGKALVSPYSSVHLNVSGLVFESETLQVRDFYRRFDVEHSRHGKEPDDHVAAELQFLAFLAQGALEQMQRAHHAAAGRADTAGAAFGAESGSPAAPDASAARTDGSAVPDAHDAADRYVTGIRQFLEQHALLWHGHLGARVSEQAQTAFYQGVGQWLVGATVDAENFFGLSPDPTRMADTVVHTKVDTSNAADEWD